MSLFMEKFKINMPEFKTGAGIVFLAAGGTFTGLALTKVHKKAEEHNKKIIIIKEKKDSMTEKEYRTEITKAHISKAVDISSDVALGVGMMTIGAALEISSTNSLRSDLTKSQLFANGVLATLSAYRGRVSDTVGAELESDIFNGRKHKKIEEVVIDPKTGKKKKVQKDIVEEPSDPIDYNPFRLVIKKGESALWTEDERIENVQTVLRCQLASANEIMMRRAQDVNNRGVGWIWLDELRMLLSEKSVGAGVCSGRDCGNIIDLQNRLGLPKHDDFVSFGLDDPCNADFWASTNMDEKTDRVYINFNCIGNIQPYLSRL